MSMELELSPPTEAITKQQLVKPYNTASVL
jgi:hypothetical protein